MINTMGNAISNVPTAVFEAVGRYEQAIEEFDKIYVYISTAYEPVVEAFWCSIGDIWKDKELWYVNATIPLIVPKELYNISVLLDINSVFVQASEPRALNVIDEFSDDFSFIHITDLHVGDPRGFTESIWRTLNL